MPQKELYHPPANMTDFDHIPNQLQQWSDAVSGWVDESIALEASRLSDYPDAKVQFYNAITDPPTGPTLDQNIIWNAFPRTLVLGYGGKQNAYAIAEQTFSLTGLRPGLPTAPTFYSDPPGTTMWSDLRYRPLDEYCEFRVERDPVTNKITKVTFTSEPPEYWMAMHGDTLSTIAGDAFKYPFTGDKKYMLDLYHKYVSKHVKMEDLECRHEYYVMVPDPNNPNNMLKQTVFHKGDYNPYNEWNSRNGIMHLAQPNNFLAAEIQLGADATLLRQINGSPVVQGDALVCCAEYGGSSRSSDPTIGASVNDLARRGFGVTIKNPIGLYMHDLNTEGFTKPNGERIDPNEYFRVERGNQSKGMIERAVFEVPAKEGFCVGDLRIGGVPINWGGQIAEHINISITGTAAISANFSNPMLPCTGFCCINPAQSSALTRPMDNGTPVPPNYQVAFTQQQGTFACTPPATGTTGTTDAALKVPAKKFTPHHKKR